MIRLFRKIRNQLLSEKSYSIYILYAAGEIVLVMVGILLALQIDNWNENNKIQKEFSEVLEEIHEDLVLDTTSISLTLAQRILDLEAQNRVIKAIRDDLPFNDQIQSDLGQIMLKRSLRLASSGFNLLRESSLTTMDDHSLRSNLIEYYEQAVKEMNEEYVDDKFEFETVLLPYIRQNFKDWDYGKFGIPLDWESLKDDHYFLTSLRLNLTNVSSTINSLQKGLHSANKILVLLDKE